MRDAPEYVHPMAILLVLLVKALWGNTKGKKGKGFVRVTRLHQHHGIKSFFYAKCCSEQEQL